MGVASLGGWWWRRADTPAPPAQTPDELPEVMPIDPKRPVENGQHAEALLNDPMLLAVFEAVADRYRHNWEASRPADLDQQRLAHLQLCALKDVVREIRSHLANARKVLADIGAREKREAHRLRQTDPTRTGFFDATDPSPR